MIPSPRDDRTHRFAGGSGAPEGRARGRRPRLQRRAHRPRRGDRSRTRTAAPAARPRRAPGHAAQHVVGRGGCLAACPTADGMAGTRRRAPLGARVTVRRRRRARRAAAPAGLQQPARRSHQPQHRSAARRACVDREHHRARWRSDAGAARLPVAPDRVPAAAHAVRRHEGLRVRAAGHTARRRQPRADRLDGSPHDRARGRDQRRRRRVGEALGIDDGARASVRGARGAPAGVVRGAPVVTGRGHPDAPGVEARTGTVVAYAASIVCRLRRAIGGSALDVRGRCRPGPRPRRTRVQAASAAAGFQQAAASSIDSYKYVGFEERFRGSQDDIRARLESYLPLFAGAATCSTWAAVAASSSSCCRPTGSAPAASTSITRWLQCAAPRGWPSRKGMR